MGKVLKTLFCFPFGPGVHARDAGDDVPRALSVLYRNDLFRWIGVESLLPIGVCPRRRAHTGAAFAQVPRESSSSTHWPFARIIRPRWTEELINLLLNLTFLPRHARSVHGESGRRSSMHIARGSGSLGGLGPCQSGRIEAAAADYGTGKGAWNQLPYAEMISRPLDRDMIINAKWKRACGCLQDTRVCIWSCDRISHVYAGTMIGKEIIVRWCVIVQYRRHERDEKDCAMAPQIIGSVCS